MRKQSADFSVSKLNKHHHTSTLTGQHSNESSSNQITGKSVYAPVKSACTEFERNANNKRTVRDQVGLGENVLVISKELSTPESKKLKRGVDVVVMDLPSSDSIIRRNKTESSLTTLSAHDYWAKKDREKIEKDKLQAKIDDGESPQQNLVPAATVPGLYNTKCINTNDNIGETEHKETKLDIVSSISKCSTENNNLHLDSAEVSRDRKVEPKEKLSKGPNFEDAILNQSPSAVSRNQKLPDKMLGTRIDNGNQNNPSLQSISMHGQHDRHHQSKRISRGNGNTAGTSSQSVEQVSVDEHLSHSSEGKVLAWSASNRSTKSSSNVSNDASSVANRSHKHQHSHQKTRDSAHKSNLISPNKSEDKTLPVQPIKLKIRDVFPSPKSSGNKHSLSKSGLSSSSNVKFDSDGQICDKKARFESSEQQDGSLKLKVSLKGSGSVATIPEELTNSTLISISASTVESERVKLVLSKDKLSGNYKSEHSSSDHHHRHSHHSKQSRSKVDNSHKDIVELSKRNINDEPIEDGELTHDEDDLITEKNKILATKTRKRQKSESHGKEKRRHIARAVFGNGHEGSYRVANSSEGSSTLYDNIHNSDKQLLHSETSPPLPSDAHSRSPLPFH
jgi:hypothetical protein